MRVNVLDRLIDEVGHDTALLHDPGIPAEAAAAAFDQTLGTFLGDSARRAFEWPLAEQRRRHPWC